MDGGGGRAWTEQRPERVSEGEWAGWNWWPEADPYESLVGPFYTRTEEGHSVCAFRAAPKHMNGQGSLHGGGLLSFADFALFCLSHKVRQGAIAVTVSLNGEFLGTAQAGERVEATGEVTKAGRSLVFIRGLVTAEGRPVLSFSGVLKKLSPRAA